VAVATILAESQLLAGRAANPAAREHGPVRQAAGPR
jgi:hypothetical protein